MGAEAYDDCIHVPCPRCQAERDTYCRNPVTDRPAQVPCLMRLRAAETDRETGSSTWECGSAGKAAHGDTRWQQTATRKR